MSPASAKREEVLSIFANDPKIAALRENDGSKLEEKPAIDEAKFQKPKKTTRRPLKKHPNQAGWSSALSNYGFDKKAAHANARNGAGKLKVGFVANSGMKKAEKENTMKWSSSQDVQTITPSVDRTQDSISVTNNVARTAASSSKPVNYTKTSAPKAKMSKATRDALRDRDPQDFPGLPKTGKAMGKAYVTKDSWDQQAQQLNKNATDQSENKGKKKKNKGKMSLRDFAMNFN